VIGPVAAAAAHIDTASAGVAFTWICLLAFALYCARAVLRFFKR
jgi:hypothetical protein